MAINFTNDWNKRIEELNRKDDNKLPAGDYSGEIIDAQLLTKEADGARYQVVEVVAKILQPAAYNGKTVKKVFIIDQAYKYAWRVQKDQNELDTLFIELNKTYKNEFELIKALYEFKSELTPIQISISNRESKDKTKTYYDVTIHSLKTKTTSATLEAKNELNSLKENRKDEISNSMEDLFNLV
ncbi:hypothetical protein ACM0LK_01250 [Mycoplasma sp. Z331B]|uniref:hypothetical protein n=1 Tax=Mycoplasma sp. Z331B TaxID=3398775 RepID=UPI003A8BBDFB